MGQALALHFQIDPHCGIPVYRQLMDQIKFYLASGALKTGDQLPSIRELARSLSVNPTTIIKAYSELEHEGTMLMRHGRGAFIAESAASMTETERKAALKRLARQLAIEAKQMGASSAMVFRVVQESLDELGKG